MDATGFEWKITDWKHLDWSGEAGTPSKGTETVGGLVPHRGRFVVRVLSGTDRIIHGMDKVEWLYECRSLNDEQTLCDGPGGHPLGFPWLFGKRNSSYVRASLNSRPVGSASDGILLAYGVCQKQ
jgi:hypothetical protein